MKEAEEDKPARFEWEHSYSMVYPPAEKYSAGGEFMSFRHYNVEVRERVKCISGVEGKNLKKRRIIRIFGVNVYKVFMYKRGHPLYSCSVLDCWSTGRAIGLAPGA